MTRFVVSDWAAHASATRSPAWKRAIYRVTRPVLSYVTQRALQPSTLERFAPDFVISERGLPIETRRHWATDYKPLTGKTVLVQGTGTGWDVVTWAERRPARILATDLFGFEASWGEVAEHCRREYGVNVEFRQAPLEHHDFLDDESVDLCASDAVFEHCTDLRKVLAESYRVLRRGGRLYASYGPLWYCAGGDHFSGRGGLRNAFNHVLLDSAAYQAYFATQKTPDEDFQSGGRYVELGLFSRLTTAEYLQLFREAGFTVESLVLQVSPDAVAFSRAYPEPFARLIARHAGRCERDDFLIKANFVRLRKSV